MSRSYPARPLRALLAAIPFLLAAPARASDTLDRSIVVLPIDTSKAGGKVTAADRASLEEMLRDEAIDTLQPLGWKVLSGDNTIQLLQDNGIDPTKCDEGSCQLGVARQMTHVDTADDGTSRRRRAPPTATSTGPITAEEE